MNEMIMFLVKRLLLVAILLAPIVASAQVTVGLDEVAVDGALLQLKDKEGITDDAENAIKGLALPRVALSDKYQLYPMFLVDPADSTSGPNTEYSANKATLDKTHTGLIVYNIVEDNEKDLCLGLNQWDGEQWSCFSSKPSVAKFTIDCDTIEVFGEYGDNTPLNTSNYIRVHLNVTHAGSYSISAITTPDNGYFYELAGSILSTGEFTLTIPGIGEPKNHTMGSNLVDPADDTPNEFTITSTGSSDSCTFEVNVISTAARPKFTIDCGATEVEGMYFEDQPLTNVPNKINGQSHRIKVTLVDIPAASYGAIAKLETNTVDGISFKGEAVLMSSTQDIYLTGTGIPRGTNDKNMIITSNSETSLASCEATVSILIPRKRLMTLGNTNNTYGYNAALVTDRTPPNSLNTMLTDHDNFGYNQWSILKFEGFKNKGTDPQANFPTGYMNDWTDDNRDIIGLDNASWNDMSATRLRQLLFGTGPEGLAKIDIFMIGHDTPYFRDGNTNDQAKVEVLIEWTKAGGILMVCSEISSSNKNFLNLFFNGTTDPDEDILIETAGGEPAGSGYTLGFNSSNTPMTMRPYYCQDNDPILQGPFENLLGRLWGEDASTTIYFSNLPLDDIVIYSGARSIEAEADDDIPAEGVTIFRHREYPFVFIGDGGFNSSHGRDEYDESSNICPFTLINKTINGRTYNNYPGVRIDFGRDDYSVYNTAFTANAFAWCIMKAEEIRRAGGGIQ